MEALNTKSVHPESHRFGGSSLISTTRCHTLSSSSLYCCGLGIPVWGYGPWFLMGSSSGAIISICSLSCNSSCACSLSLSMFKPLLLVSMKQLLYLLVSKFHISQVSVDCSDSLLGSWAGNPDWGQEQVDEASIYSATILSYNIPLLVLMWLIFCILSYIITYISYIPLFS